MKTIFEPGELFPIPDGSLISPFLNPADSMSGLPVDLLDGFSAAYGVIPANTNSKIHIHPHVDQVTYVLGGKITLKMKGVADDEAYSVSLAADQAAVLRNGEYFQLINRGSSECRVLYVVSPAYLFVLENKELVYDDAIVLDYDWHELEAMSWQPPELAEAIHSAEARAEALRRLQESAKS